MDSKSEHVANNIIDTYLANKKGAIVLDRNDEENYVSYKTITKTGAEELVDVFLATPEHVLGERIRNDAGGVQLEYAGEIAIGVSARFVGKVPHDFLNITYHTGNSISWLDFDHNGELRRMRFAFGDEPLKSIFLARDENNDMWRIDHSPISFPYETALGDNVMHAQVDDGLMTVRVEDKNEERMKSFSTPLKFNAAEFYQRAKHDGGDWINLRNELPVKLSVEEIRKD